MTDADTKVLAFVTRVARARGHDAHLRECPDLVVEYPEVDDSGYGCDTGCEYVQLDADLSCPHGHAERFAYGEFGDLPSLIKWVDTW